MSVASRVRTWAAPAIAAAIAVAVRADEWRHADVFIDSDNAIGPLMARHIWQDGYRPLMLSGQDYIGAMEAYLYAPLLTCFDTVHAFATVELLLFALTMFPLYVLLVPVGGRAGAMAGLLVWAVGSPWWTALTTTAPMGYLSSLLLGTWLLVVVRSRPTRWRLGLAGFLVGLGYWNNPMSLAFAVTAGAAWLPHTATFTRRGSLPHAARPGLVLCALGAVAAVAALVLPFTGIQAIAGISLTHPERYLPRALLAIALGAAWVDRSIGDRRRWGRGAAALLAGGILGALPLIAHRIGGQAAGHGARLQFSLEHAVENLGRIAPLVGQVTFGEQTGLGVAIEVALAALLIAWLVHYRAAWTGLLRLRCESGAPGGVLLLPGLVTVCLLELRGGLQWHRYLIPVMLAVPALVAWAVSAQRGRWRWFGLGLLALILVHDGVQQHREHARLVSRQLHRRVVADLTRSGVAFGFGQYWVCYRFDALLDRGPCLACSYDGAGNLDRLAWYRDEAERARRSGRMLVRLYDFDGGLVELAMPERAREDASLQAEFLDEHGSEVRRRRSWGGRYFAFFYRER